MALLKTESISDAAYRMGEGVGDVVSPVNNFLEIFWGGDPIKAYTATVRSSFSDILWGVPRMMGHAGMGILKGAGSLAWNAALRAPILPFQTMSAESIIEGTQQKLASLSDSIMNYQVLGGPSPTESLASAA